MATVLAVAGMGYTAIAQSAPSANRPPYDGADSPNGPMPIHVDQNCRILPGNNNVLQLKKQHPYHDNAVCRLESVHASEHWEEHITGNELFRTYVRVNEHEFVLQNVSDKQVMFIVEQTVPQNWRIDSDPQPWQVTGKTAWFHVYVKPGETVRLHVGMRREWPQAPKPI